MLYRAIVTVLCLLGIVLQGYYTSKRYFEYDTITKVNVEADEILTPQAVIVCFNLVDIVNAYKNKTAPSNVTILDDVVSHSNTILSREPLRTS